jgi:preprotein translocase subunit SecE
VKVTAAASNAVRYLGEVRAEVQKVTWPGWDELRKSTVLIIIFVIILGLVIAIMDWAFSFMLVQLPARLFG